MMKKLTFISHLALLALLVLGCQKEQENKQETINLESNSAIETSISFDENYRPSWWEKKEDKNFLYSYAYIDGTDKEAIKVEAINSAQAKFLHYKKDYIVNLTEIILAETGLKDKVKSNKIKAYNDLVYKKDFSAFLKRAETDYINKNTEYRCFVAISLPLEVLQKEYVKQFNKNADFAKNFAESDTYRYLLKVAGIENTAPKKEISKKEENKIIKKEVLSEKKYEADIIPAWFKVSYNNKKVMINQTASESNEELSQKKAISLCQKTKLKIANDFARAEAEKYRGASGYDEVKFSKLKDKISQEINRENYPINKEFIKTIQLTKDSFKTYAQYSIDKKLIQSTLIRVLKSDDVLYSRLKASMAFDELENEEF